MEEPRIKDLRLMAGDWLKIEKGTPGKAEIRGIANRLGCSRGDAFLACFIFWSWADEQSTDGHVSFVTLSDIDDISGREGFAQAALEVGWLQARSGSFVIPRFDRHMSQGAKNRALALDRKRGQRSRKCHDASVTKTGPEKRRDREENKPPTPFKPPSLEEVKAYCAERKNHVDPQKWLDHYTANGWRVGKVKMSDWRAAVRTWEKNEFNGKPKTTVQQPLELLKGHREHMDRIKEGTA